MNEPKRQTITLYVLSVLASGCGFVSQMLVSGYWATTFSNDVHHFSVNLACYFLCMGLGSLLFTRWKSPDLDLLLRLTIGLCFWTGISIAIVRHGISYYGEWALLSIGTVAVSGLIAGTIIPLTLKIGEANPKIKLSVLFFLDYTAAIFFTLTFTFVFLVPLGYGMTAVILSAFCTLLVAGLVFWEKKATGPVLIVLFFVLLAPYPIYHGVRSSSAPRMDNRGDAKVLVNKQSHYQKIVLTEETSDSPHLAGLKKHVLYLDGFVQFSSIDEQGYHLCIANIPASAVEFMGGTIKKALVLGGGDGLAARNLMGIKSIESITNVELDPEVISLSRNSPIVRMYNLDSFRNEKVKVVAADAFRWVKESNETFDLIVIDFPAPKNIGISRLFTAEFYSDVFKLLAPNGFVSIQAGPSYSFEDPSRLLSRVPTCVKDTIRSLGFNAHIYVNARDEDSFVLATKQNDFDMVEFTQNIGILGREGLGMICTYNPNWEQYEVEINTLNTLELTNYMRVWFEQAGRPFFYYRGSHSVFLPE